MHFFKNHEDGLNKQPNGFPMAANSILSGKQTLFDILTGEENPLSIGSLLLIFVLLAHVRGALWLLQPVAPITLAQPLLMEVSLVSTPGEKPITATATPALPKAVEPVKPPVQPKKPPVKKTVKKKTPMLRKQAKLPKPVAVSDAMLPAPSLTESFEDAAETSHAAAPVVNTAKAAKQSQSHAEPYSEANFSANYGTNPKPKYPAIARSRGWQGKVLLRVKVTADGLSEAVTVHQSSGHDALDESAVAAVEKWKFIPAKRGNTAVACTVIVPIIFTLNN